jgi:hypothetical protein
MRRNPRLARFGAPLLLWLAPAALAMGCTGGGESGSPTAGATSDLRVAECEEYASRMAICLHRSELLADFPSVAHNESERDQMRASCSQGLQLLTASCH